MMRRQSFCIVNRFYIKCKILNFVDITIIVITIIVTSKTFFLYRKSFLRKIWNLIVIIIFTNARFRNRRWMGKIIFCFLNHCYIKPRIRDFIVITIIINTIIVTFSSIVHWFYEKIVDHNNLIDLIWSIAPFNWKYDVLRL